MAISSCRETAKHAKLPDVAAVALMVNYFEGIEIYVTGEDSKNKSFEFFTRGFGESPPFEDRTQSSHARSPQRYTAK